MLEDVSCIERVENKAIWHEELMDKVNRGAELNDYEVGLQEMKWNIHLLESRKTRSKKSFPKLKWTGKYACSSYIA